MAYGVRTRISVRLRSIQRAAVRITRRSLTYRQVNPPLSVRAPHTRMPSTRESTETVDAHFVQRVPAGRLLALFPAPERPPRSRWPAPCGRRLAGHNAHRRRPRAHRVAHTHRSVQDRPARAPTDSTARHCRHCIPVALRKHRVRICATQQVQDGHAVAQLVAVLQDGVLQVGQAGLIWRMRCRRSIWPHQVGCAHKVVVVVWLQASQPSLSTLLSPCSWRRHRSR